MTLQDRRGAERLTRRPGPYRLGYHHHRTCSGDGWRMRNTLLTLDGDAAVGPDAVDDLVALVGVEGARPLDVVAARVERAGNLVERPRHGPVTSQGPMSVTRTRAVILT
jgi:hypothetical protein